MKWPWVSRAHFDLLQHNYAEMAAEWRAQRTFHAAEQKRFDVLLEKYHALKLQGAVIPEPVVVRSAKEPDPVVQQINMLSAGKPGLRALMMRQVNVDRTVEQLDDIEIMRKIEAGIANEEGVPA